MRAPAKTISRRRFLRAAMAAAGTAALPSVAGGCSGPGPDHSTARSGAPCAAFTTRGVVLVPGDLTFRGWPELASRAGLTTIGLHHGTSPRAVAQFIQSQEGTTFLASCSRLGLEVEYELHAMGELLPRELFVRDPTLFRMDDRGERNPDANLCVHSRHALEIASANAVELARILRPSMGRYFFWGDDGKPWCRCPACRPFTDSDQALLLENRLIAALRREDPRAQLAHLAYANTREPPRQVRPEPGVFLEFAPIEMRHQRELSRLEDAANRPFLDALEANLEVFPRDSAQALEYWLDVSMYSGWRKPARKLPFSEAAVDADLDVYRRYGVGHVTSFAVFIDAEYIARFGEAVEVVKYGALLGGRNKS